MFQSIFRALALSICVAASLGAAQAQYNPATQGKPPLYVDPKYQGTGQMIFFRGTGLCFAAQNGVFRDWVPIVLEPCNGAARQQFVQDGAVIRLAPNQHLCLDRQRIQSGTETGELNLENCSEKRTSWRYDAGAGQIRGTSHINYSICLYPQGGAYRAGVRMMAGPQGCGGRPLSFGSLQAAQAGAGPAQPSAPQAPASQPNARQPYQVYWRQVGGPWSTGPYPSATPTCLHGNSNAACNGQNFKGVYQPGQTTTFWLNGCQNPPLTIRCEVRTASGQTLGAPPRPPQTASTASSFGDRPGPGCPTPGMYKSPASKQPAKVVFTNRADRAINVYWIGFDGKAKEYAALLPGESKSIQTYVGHAWIGKAFDGACFGGLHIMKAGPNTIVLR